MTRNIIIMLIALSIAIAIGLSVPWVVAKLVEAWYTLPSDSMGGM